VSVVSLLTQLSRGVMGWVNKVGKKITDSRELCLIINVFIIGRLNKIRLRCVADDSSRKGRNRFESRFE